MKLYWYPKCSSCRKALKFLKDNGVELTPIDLTEKVPSKSELLVAFKSVDENIRKLFNTSGRVYREQGVKEKLSSMTRDQAVTLLRSEGMLIKRPLLIDGSNACVGFNEKVWEEFLGL